MAARFSLVVKSTVAAGSYGLGPFTTTKFSLPVKVLPSFETVTV